MFKRLGATLITGALAMCVLVGCDDDHHAEDDHHSEGKPTGAECATGSTLTYQNFGQSFMESYCTRCHSSALTGEARNGAPDDHDFDALEGVLSMADHIDEYAGAGPASINTAMPPSDPKPSEEERRQLAEWLACEAMR